MGVGADPGILPMGKDGPEGRPPDDRWRGMVDLFAELNALDSKVIPGFPVRRRHPEFVTFLNTLDRQSTSAGRPGVVPTKLRAHTTEQVPGWLGRRPRFLFHIPRRVPHGPFGWRSGWGTGRGGLWGGEASEVCRISRRRSWTPGMRARSGGALRWTKDALEILRIVRKIRALPSERAAAPVDRKLSHPLETDR